MTVDEIKSDEKKNQVKVLSNRFVVTKNNPFYPDVEYFDTLHDAIAQRDEWISDMKSENGNYQCCITISIEFESKIIKCNY